MRLAFASPASTFVDGDGYAPISGDSQALSQHWRAQRNFLRHTASDWLPLVAAVLKDIQVDSAAANWDGEGATPVSAETIALTMAVADTLFALVPKGTPAPDVIPEADGEICLTWRADDEHVISVSIGEHGNANYAAQLGREGGRHGWTPLGTTDGAALERSLREVAGHIDHVYRAAFRPRGARGGDQQLRHR
jgi:hypothetical protein